MRAFTRHQKEVLPKWVLRDDRHQLREMLRKHKQGLITSGDLLEAGNEFQATHGERDVLLWRVQRQWLEGNQLDRDAAAAARKERAQS